MSTWRVLVGDCLEHMRRMEADSVDAIVTDVPYNEVNRQSNGLREWDKGEADTADFDAGAFVAEAFRVCSGSFYVFCAWEQTSELLAAFRSHDLSVRLGFWHKSNPPVANGEYLWLSAVECCVYAKKPGASFFRHCKAPVWHGPIERGIDWHPTPKPVWLMRELVTASVPERGTVLDPYMGSGPTGVACLVENRHFIGCELNEDWAAQAERRMRDVNLDLFHGHGEVHAATRWP